MSRIDKSKAEEIAEDHIRKMYTFRLETIEDTSNLTCYDISDFSDYYVFWFSSGKHVMVGQSSYVAVCS